MIYVVGLIFSSHRLLFGLMKTISLKVKAFSFIRLSCGAE